MGSSKCGMVRRLRGAGPVAAAVAPVKTAAVATNVIPIDIASSSAEATDIGPVAVV